eukprot:m.65913 g.65913  ORF g.65913 m.65913 type:complete len:371 (-) comp18026_c0_seq1:77-1189(-)
MVWDWLREPCGRPLPSAGDDAVSGVGSGDGPAVPHPADPAAATLPAGTLAAAITPAATLALEAVGWAVIDGAVGTAVASQLRSELDELRAAGGMHPNQTSFGRPPKRYIKPHVYEYDMHAVERDPVAVGRLRAFRELFDHAATSLVDRLNALLPDISLERGKRAVVVKLQYNDGDGGCFPLHYDNPGPPNRRVLTCLLYLNPGWVEGDGGELQLVPFCDGTVRIPPSHDRLVLFYSDRVLHRVLPTTRPRYCFTVWLDGTAARNARETEHPLAAVNVAAADVAVVATRYRDSPHQRELSRSVYREAYEQSLVECQGVGAPCMVEQHRTAVDHTDAVPRLTELVQRLRHHNATAQHTRTVPATAEPSSAVS